MYKKGGKISLSVSWCYMRPMRISLQLVSQSSKQESIASCRRHVTSCNLGLQRVMVPEKSLLQNQAVHLVLHGAIFFCDLCCNGVARQAAVRFQLVTCPLCNLSRNSLGIATINSTFCDNCIDCFETMQLAAQDCRRVKPSLHKVVTIAGHASDDAPKREGGGAVGMTPQRFFKHNSA